MKPLTIILTLLTSIAFSVFSAPLSVNSQVGSTPIARAYVGDLLLFGSQPTDIVPGKAVSIGINAYPTGLTLPGSVYSAEMMGNAFSNVGYNVSYLMDTAATKTAILNALTQLVSEAKPYQRILLMFNGHGTYSTQPDSSRLYKMMVYKNDTQTDTITETELMAIVNDNLPPTVEFTLFTGSCYSGHIARNSLKVVEFGAAEGTGVQRIYHVPKYIFPENWGPVKYVSDFAYITSDIIMANPTARYTPVEMIYKMTNATYGASIIMFAPDSKLGKPCY